MTESVELWRGYSHYVAQDPDNAPYLALLFPGLEQRGHSEYDNFYACDTKTIDWRTLRCLETTKGGVRYVDPHPKQWARGQAVFAEEEFANRLYVYEHGSKGRASYRLNPPYYATGSPSGRVWAIETQPLPRAPRQIAFHGRSQDGMLRLVVTCAMFYGRDAAHHRLYLGSVRLARLPRCRLRKPIKGVYNDTAETLTCIIEGGQELLLSFVGGDMYSAMLGQTAFTLPPAEDLQFMEERQFLTIRAD